MTQANDDNALAAMAGDMPETVNVLDRPVKTLGQQVMANKERAITMVADELFGAGQWKREAIRGHIYQNGREVYQFRGVEFIELSPLEFSSEQKGESFHITATQRWRKLEPQP